MKTYQFCECWGQDPGDETCPLCGGDGRLLVEDEIDEEEAAREKEREDWREWADLCAHGMME